MSRIVFQSEGLSDLIKDVEGYTKELNKEIGFAITDNLEAVDKHATKNHRYTSRNGQAGLEGAVQTEYKLQGSVHKVKIFLNDKFTTVKTKHGDRSYGVFIHEGTYQGYKQSKIAPRYKSSKSKSGEGWKADPFLWRAINQKWKLTRDLKKLTAKLRKKYERV